MQRFANKKSTSSFLIHVLLVFWLDVQGSTLKGLTLDHHHKEKQLESDGKFYLERIDTPFL
jgi:hypothetical protein